jgi:hypothetical protein
MAESWLRIPLILGVDLLVIGLVGTIVFVVFTGSGWWQARRQARRFAEAVASNDFEQAETIVRAAPQRAGKTDLAG